MPSTLPQTCGECIYWNPLDKRRSRGECRAVLVAPMPNVKKTGHLREWPETDPLNVGCLAGATEADHLPKSCAVCIAWLQTGVDGDMKTGQCRRRRPEYVPKWKDNPPGAQWPAIPGHLWCGEGVAIPSAEEASSSPAQAGALTPALVKT
jgi:hypothetical protein